MQFQVKLRRAETGEEHTRLIFAPDEAAARQQAITRARATLGLFFGAFEVIGLTPCFSKRRPGIITRGARR